MKNQIPFLLLFLFMHSKMLSQVTCSVSNISLTPVPNKPLEYDISFSLTVSQPVNAQLLIAGSMPNGGNLMSNPIQVQTNTGTTIQLSGKINSGNTRIPANTPIQLNFILARICSTTVTVNFPPHVVSECHYLQTSSIQCQSNGRLRYTHRLETLMGNFASATVKLTLYNGTFSSPGAGGTLSANNSVLQYSVSALNSTSGVFSYTAQTTSGSTPVIFAEIIAPNGNVLCAGNIMIAPHTSLCVKQERICDNLTPNFISSALIPQGNILQTAFSIQPASGANLMMINVSLVNVERRSECPNTPPTEWTSILSNNQPYINISGIPGAVQANLPVPNSISVNYNPPLNASNTIYFNIPFAALPAKTGTCTERLRFTIRMVFRNNNNCEFEVLRFAEIQR
ncbi:MAG: hypothetical protein N2747_07545 [Chitinophagaceae bacterium]|nr:hypothetical protein [Chitinophagaceae bacterium]